MNTERVIKKRKKQEIENLNENRLRTARRTKKCSVVV